MYIKAILITTFMVFSFGCRDKSKFTYKRDPPVNNVGPQGPQGIPGESIEGPEGTQGIPGVSIVGPQGPFGPKGMTGASGQSIVGPVGPKGNPGEDGVNAIKPQVYLIPTRGKCVQLDSGIYVENEGDVADFYKTSSCNHGSNDSNVYCNNVTDGEVGASDREVCTVIFSNQKMYRFTIVGRGSDMCVVEETFVDLPAYKLLD